MPRGILYVAAALLTLHGLVHLMGLVAYWPITTLQGIPYKTTLLDGRWDLGKTGIRLFSVVWLVAAIGFVIAAAGMVTHQDWWQVALAGVTLLSLVIAALDVRVAFMGVLIDALILGALVIGLVVSR
jgi:uncharacterized membrane protein YhdT